jgi:uncharacterized protein (DUF608 family)
MQEEFISVSELISKEKLLSIYQVQGQENTDQCKIVCVGEAEELPFILIKSFNYKDADCKLLSFMYTEHYLDEAKKINTYSLIELQIKRGDIKTILRFNFHANDKDTMSLNKNIKGYFTVSQHHHEDYRILKTLKQFPGNNLIISHLLEHLRK